MVSAETRLQELDIQLPQVPQPLGLYTATVQTGNLLFLSGMLPVENQKPKYSGSIGIELDAKRGREAARTAALNALAAARQHLGSLDKVTRIVRLGVYMVTSKDFFEQPYVADGASQLFNSILGENKMSTRLLIGVAHLPLSVPIELEVIFEVEG